MSEIGDRFDHLRIPFEKIKFGKKLEVQGYGTVFEGEFGDQRVALKQLNITNLANIKPKLLAEILTISQFRQHPNLVALLGFCDEKNNEITLVYEYVASGNLADKMRKRLTTIQRLEICLDAARGLDYLHTGVDRTAGIVHGNIKPSKILLNSDSDSNSNSTKFKAKVSSFGLSKIVPGAQKNLETSDLEKVTKESDVYAFGVLLLEVLCGVSELVDTDDYQERHVTELVPKRMEQNKLRKIVHFDIRKEIKTESLETYAKIACQCVMEDPEARPTMAQVVEELEKALRLQGGDVSYVKIPTSGGIARAEDETVIDGSPSDNGNGETVDSNVVGNEPMVEKFSSTVEAVNDSIAGHKLDVAGEVNSDENSIVTTTEERSFNVPILDSERNTEEITENLNSIEKSNVTEENEDYNQITKLDMLSESSNGDTSTTNYSTNQEVQNSGNQNVDSLPNDKEVEDELDHLRIPFENIKFGKKIDSGGYGSLFEGEFNDQHVALKRLNITNLAKIKPKLLAEIVTVARFRKHPNVVTLIGFCDENSNELILVYEYVSSGNLADRMSKHLTTVQRLEICLGAARGLEYLHTGIVHGNIKLSKILLNSDSNSTKFEAKVSGFGFSKLLPGDVQIAQKAIDPAYEVTGELTRESDVYSFGVLLLEVLCGVPELVATDDYQERHVTELVPKRLEQNLLRKIVHFDIRDEITPESLETYAKIACRSVMKTPEERPTMAEVVIELEKALRLQGGEVSGVQILGGRNGNSLDEETVDNGETMSLNIVEEESEVKIATIKVTVDDIAVETRSSHVLIPDSLDGETEPNNIHIKAAQKEGNNNVLISTNDQETTTQIIKESNSTITGALDEDNNQSTKLTPSSESINGDTNNELQNSKFLESASRSFDNLPYENQNDDIEDELYHLRIPLNKIKFGKKIDVRGYGSLFEGECNNQQVALKRLNITNLAKIKPKLLAEIVTVARFRKHPNLVALIGFCDEKSNELILVYEHVSSGNLADKMSKHLTAIQRLEICLGAARGLEFLHTGIIHGNIKLSKILLNSETNSTKFEAKVSGFGFSKLLPGDVQIAPKSIDPAYEVTGKLTKESDVYSFGVLLLEVLCGVPELVDTDDYQERHVTELVPKRLEQNNLRKIVHFDIRDEITTESLETYAKIACRSVAKKPEERPTMDEIVVELELALRLQGGELPDVRILGAGNDKGLTEETVDKYDQKEDDIAEEEPLVIEEIINDIVTQEDSFPVPILVSKDVESEPDVTENEDAEKENGSTNEPENAEQILVADNTEEILVSDNTEEILVSDNTEEIPVADNTEENLVSDNTEQIPVADNTEEILVDLDSNEESNIIVENDLDNESRVITTAEESNNGDDTNSVEKIDRDDPEPMPKIKDEIEIMDNKIPAMEITLEVQNTEILDLSNSKAIKHSTLMKSEKKPDLVVDIREGGFSNSATNDKLLSESKRSNSTCSESSNGDGTTPSDFLLQKTPLDKTKTTTKKTSKRSRNCGSGSGSDCGCCACWQYLWNRIVFYGGQFWNKLVSCFTWITGQCSSKND